MDPTDLERHVDRALKALPAPRAPHSLLPAVMLAVRAAALRPWYARPWAGWPGQWQAASVAAVLAFLAVGAVLLPAAPHVAALDVVVAPASAFFSQVETFVSVVEILARTVRQSVIGIALGVVVIMMATSVAVGAAIGRLAAGGVRS